MIVHLLGYVHTSSTAYDFKCKVNKYRKHSLVGKDRAGYAL